MDVVFIFITYIKQTVSLVCSANVHRDVTMTPRTHEEQAFAFKPVHLLNHKLVIARIDVVNESISSAQKLAAV